MILVIILIQGRHKRNATFPGGQSSATTASSTNNARGNKIYSLRINVVIRVVLYI